METGKLKIEINSKDDHRSLCIYETEPGQLTFEIIDAKSEKNSGFFISTHEFSALFEQLVQSNRKIV